MYGRDGRRGAQLESARAPRPPPASREVSVCYRLRDDKGPTLTITVVMLGHSEHGSGRPRASRASIPGGQARAEEGRVAPRSGSPSASPPPPPGRV